MNSLIYWFYIVSRGYSLPMSILNWLVVFVFCLKFYNNSNILYGILALIAIVFAHLGTNLFDDFIDTIFKVPKQKCKTQYLDSGFTTIKKVGFISLLYFAIAFLIGLFFFFKFGMTIIYLTLPAVVIILSYPKLNYFALGELAIGACFGFLMFTGVSFVMTGQFDINAVLISIPVSLLTITAGYVHSIMDYDFDIKNNKHTLPIVLGSKQNALKGLILIYFLTFVITFYLVYRNILPSLALITFLLFPLVIKLCKSITKNNSFMQNFVLSRNISLLYNVILIISFLVKL